MTRHTVRVTVDLEPDLHRQLTTWAAAAAAELERPRVTVSDAIRAMVDLTTEPGSDVAPLVVAHLRGQPTLRERELAL